MLSEKVLGPSTWRTAASLAIALVIGHASVAFAAGDTNSPASTSGASAPTSIWDLPVGPSGQTRESLALGTSSDDQLEPILLPLPAPVIAAGAGLCLVLALRHRAKRS